jgi:CrcB protein
MGVASQYFLSRSGADLPLRLFVVTGLLGGFTTFSAFSLDIVALYTRGQSMTALVYAVSSVLLSLAALVGGLAVVRFFLGSSHPL